MLYEVITIRSPGGGDNLFLCSIIAVRPDTGDYVWHYQAVPGENWDYNCTQQMTLAELTIGGETRKVLMQAAKSGFFYVLDRTNGELISANNFVPVTWASHVITSYSIHYTKLYENICISVESRAMR